MKTLEFTDEQVLLIQHALGLAEQQFINTHKNLSALTEVRLNGEKEEQREANKAYLHYSFRFADLNESIQKELVAD